MSADTAGILTGVVNRLVLILSVGLVVLAACGGDDGGANAEGSSTTTAPAKEQCTAADAVADAYDALESPGVFQLDPSDVADVFAERRDAVSALAKLIEDEEDHAALEDLHGDLVGSDPAQVDALVSNHDVVAEIGMTWRFVVMTSTVVTKEENAAYLRSRDGFWPVGKVLSGCKAPERLMQPTEDVEGDVEGGTILFETFGHEDRGLRAVDVNGGESAAIDPPEGWDDLDEPMVGPDGRTIVAIARRGGTSPAVGIARGHLADGFEVVYETSEAELTCPRIDDQGQVLVTELGQSGRPNKLLSVVEGVADEVMLPVADFYCADRLSADELLLGSATDDRQIYGGVSTVRGSSDDVPLYTPTGCNNVITGLAPDQMHELVIESCDDLTQSGLYVVNIDDGEAERIVDWPSAIAKWSPTGEWIVFGLGPTSGPQEDTVRVWMVRPDGSGLRRLTDVPSSFPAWVSDELTN